MTQVNPSLTFIGHYGVRKELQGTGLGYKQWEAAMEYCHKISRCTALWAVPNMMFKYQSSGFIHQYPHKVLMFYSDSADSSRFIQSLPNIEIAVITSANENQVIDYDQDVVKYRREKILKLYFREEDSLSLAAVDSSNGNKIVGFICIKKNIISKALIGPLYANESDIANLLMGAAISRFPLAQEGGVIYQPFEHRSEAVRIAMDFLNSKHVQTLCLMLTRDSILAMADDDRIFNITNNGFEPW